jgi:hypothetical protein
MNYIKAQVESKQFALTIMLENVELFGGQREVDRKAAMLRHEIAVLVLSLDAWH